MSHKIVSHSIVALLFTGIVAGVSVGGSGCGGPTERQAPSTKVETLGTIDAQPQTLAETGIASWTATRQGSEVLLDGKTADGVSIHQLRISGFSAKVRKDGHFEALTGFVVRSSNEGLMRVTRDGRLVDFRADDVVFPAFARDTAVFHRGDVTLDCTFWGWLGCFGAIGAAVIACGGPEDWPCIVAILGSLGCIDCFCGQYPEVCDPGGGTGGAGGGSGGGPGDECYDCGDGRIVCPPQVCP